MRTRTSRQKTQQVASNVVYPSRHDQNHHQDPLPMVVDPFESVSEVKIQCKRLSLGNDRNNNHYMDALSCDCSISTLGDEFSSHEGGHGGDLLPESPNRPIHRWKQNSGNYHSEDLPPIGPRRSTGCLIDSVIFPDHTTNEATSPTGTTAGTNSSRHRRSIHSASDVECSEATDIIEELATTIESNQNVMDEILQRLGRRPAPDNTSTVKRMSHSIKKLHSSSNSSTRRRSLPIRLPSKDSMESLSTPVKKHDGGSRESLDGSRDRFLRSVDTPPSIARRKPSHHIRPELSTDEKEDCDNDYYEFCDDDDGGRWIASQEPPQIPSPRPLELARRLTSPFPNMEQLNGVSLKACEIRALGIEAEKQLP